MSLNVTYQLRSFRVKTTPGTILNEVLTNACDHFDLDASSYQLYHGTRLLDLSLPVRLTGLAQGAKLELKVGKAVGNVTLRFSIVGRTLNVDPKSLVLTVKSSNTIRSVLVLLGKNIGLDLSSENFTIQSFSLRISPGPDFDKPLSSLGLSSGNSVMRLVFEAQGPTTKSEKKVSSPSSSALPTSAPATETHQDIKDTPNHDSTVVKDTAAGEKSTKAHIFQAQAFKPSSNRIHSSQDDDEVYELSVDQALKYQAILSKQAHASPMMRRLAEEKKKNAKKIDNCHIRIRFPDHSNLELTIDASITLKQLCSILTTDFLSLNEEEKNAQNAFNLYIPHPHQILNTTANMNKRLDSDLKFGPRILLLYESANKVSKISYLKPEYLKDAKSIEDAPDVLRDREIEMGVDSTPVSQSPVSAVDQSSFESPTNSSLKKKVPKWLKLGKK
ncbi:UBX domain-containing protein 4 [Komagataella phaffii CBS 7435]|uniref:UBX (Ubiquitin regulatory X) domain-containing protein that interacts with Cdc48p n=2 Tax=Komagataella phaffii TaxID=460519 RepID=C4R030_KOMPG|nr:UBX (ubiquitin regulatory X) domain-containing protein that interacts with Cdc48p [Komagataella phaffii GS115]AOA62672.1 GQ67_00272T0 [Komagataella phaffii]CAH2448645.1 UBX domain-containing protein 4 [Komagataella phaffii CBS 7435]AOA67831.1 GQ68_01117T0 [Komagataella phaffii GS115]CAY68854.1 UBX (ubiquitin regulatory X) domain-containing protein that interacts with Cdc48p [Komagataella phaffii GS115]CCA38739.1 UBX domain-containing protein 4 [Komagataella phaffii CBS 7435]